MQMVRMGALPVLTIDEVRPGVVPNYHCPAITLVPQSKPAPIL